LTRRQVLQQHCNFFDADHDGVIWPTDTLVGFHKLGFGILLSLVAVVVIHSNFSYPTLPTFLPDPFFRIYVDNIHKDKHGSDTGTYDNEGRFIPQKFEDIFSKYSTGEESLTFWEAMNLLKGQRCIMDPVGWGGAFFECMRSRRRTRSSLADMSRAGDVHFAMARRWADEEGGYPTGL
jgi:peroxygenase